MSADITIYSYGWGVTNYFNMLYIIWKIWGTRSSLYSETCLKGRKAFFVCLCDFGHKLHFTQREIIVISGHRLC